MVNSRIIELVCIILYPYFLYKTKNMFCVELARDVCVGSVLTPPLCEFGNSYSVQIQNFSLLHFIYLQQMFTRLYIYLVSMDTGVRFQSMDQSILFSGLHILYSILLNYRSHIVHIKYMYTHCVFYQSICTFSPRMLPKLSNFCLFYNDLVKQQQLLR